MKILLNNDKFFYSELIILQAGVINVTNIIRPQPQPQLPERPCLPPRPRAMEPRNDEDSPPLLTTSPQETYQASTAIYEEIKDDIVRRRKLIIVNC